MPKQVDHEERRRHIAAAVVRLARQRGLQGVSFREVASEAGVSVALVQHYFGSKENLLIGTIDLESARLGAIITDRLERLGAGATPLDRLRAVAGSFLATDPESREAMLLYHSFGAAALTDQGLRGAEAFRNADNLMGVLGMLLESAQTAGEVAIETDPELAAWAILALVLGLSMSVLLNQLPPDRAEAALDSHLRLLAPKELRLLIGPGLEDGGSYPDRMTDPLEDVEASLRRRRSELSEEFERLTEPPAEGAAISFGKRVGDGTAEAVERLATTATARSLAASIADIDRALEKIADRTYGICDTCGNEIAEARLEALPATTRCVDCAVRADRCGPVTVLERRCVIVSTEEKGADMAHLDTVPEATDQQTKRTIPTQAVGFALISGAYAVVMAGVVLFTDGTDAGPIPIFVVLGALVTWGLWKSDALWLVIAGLVLNVLVLMTFFLSFGVLQLFSPVDFIGGLLWLVGFFMALIGGIMALSKRRREAGVGETGLRVRKAVLGAIGVLSVVSVVGFVVTRTTVSAAEAADAATIDMVNFEFAPETLAAAAGQDLLLTNSDGFAHDFRIDALDVNEKLLPGSEAIVDLEGVPAGTYQFYCSLHSDGVSGMMGTVTVTG